MNKPKWLDKFNWHAIATIITALATCGIFYVYFSWDTIIGLIQRTVNRPQRANRAQLGSVE